MTAKNPFVFVTPENSDGVSGGNLYNKGLQNSLQNLRDLRCLDLAQWQNEEPRAGVYLIDTLHLAEFDKMLSRRVPGQRFVLLVHHLPSLEPGLAPDDPARLAETRVIAHFDAYLATSQFTSQLIRSRGSNCEDFRRMATCGDGLKARISLPQPHGWRLSVLLSRRPGTSVCRS